MSDTQKILLILAGALHNGQVGEDMCLGLARALDAVPHEYHMSALIAMLSERGYEDAE